MSNYFYKIIHALRERVKHVDYYDVLLAILVNIIFILYLFAQKEC